MDPMMALMFAQGLQGFADNLGAARRGVAPPQRAGVQDMVPMMSMMQRNQLAQQQFAIKQQQAKEEAARNEAAARALGIDPAILALNPSEFGKNAAEASGVQVLSPGQRAMIGERVIANNPALLQVAPGGFADVQNGTYTKNPELFASELSKASAGSTRLSVDARNMQDAQTEMLKAGVSQLMDHQKAASDAGDSARKFDELATIALENPSAFGSKAAAVNAWNTVVDMMPGGASEEQKKQMAIYKNASELQNSIAVKKTAELRPASDLDFNAQLKSTVGPTDNVPSVLLMALRHKSDAAWLKRYELEYTRSMKDAMDSKQYNPVEHNLHMQEWAAAPENSPYSTKSFVDTAMKLSKEFSGNGAKTPAPGSPAAANPAVGSMSQNASQYIVMP